MIYLAALSEGLLKILNWECMLLLLAGVLIGTVIAILPGLGGIVGISICLPFVWGMKPPENALALLIGIVAVMRTADTIPAVLFAVPGTVGAQTTILDGYSLAKKGEAARALGAAFTASTTGAILGALALVISVPIGRPLVMAFGSPQFFMLVVLGLVMVASLSGQHIVKGVICALLGLLLASVGGAAGALQFRYTFDHPYLNTGIPLLSVALGLFAIPETVDLLISGTSIASTAKLGKGLIDGAKDVLHHWFLTVRCSALGAFIGFLPGLGASPAAWIAYGHAVQTARDKSQFGKGDIRGVIAPESANNAADAGAIIPALLFGIPGSGTMAIFLFAMTTLDIVPGPNLLSQRLSIPFTIAWELAFGAIIAAGVSVLLVKPLARLTTVRIQYLAPFIFLAVVLAAYQSTSDWGDLVTLLGISILGWFMKRTKWPRPPVLIGFVLGAMAERYLWTSIARYGITWLWNPWVIGIGLATIIPVIVGIRGMRKVHGGG